MSKILPKIKTICRPIYKTIDVLGFEEMIFSQSFLDLYKKNPNENQFLSSDVKKILKIMAMEQGLYTKVVMVCRKGFYYKKKIIIPRNITYRGSLQDQNSGSILIMSG